MLSAELLVCRDIKGLPRAFGQASTDFFGPFANSPCKPEFASQDMMQRLPFYLSAILQAVGWTQIQAVLRLFTHAGDIRDRHYLFETDARIPLPEPRSPLLRAIRSDIHPLRASRQPSTVNAPSKGHRDDAD